MHNYKLSYKLFGEKAILIEWPSEINTKILNDIVIFKEKIQKNIKLQDVITGYNSLLLVYNFVIEKQKSKLLFLEELYQQKTTVKELNINHWDIPVCYDVSFGIDLEVISKEKNISKEDIISLHENAVYTVFFIGFLPGFLYLGGLNSKLNIPRKKTPRLRVAKGAVAIGGEQTGVYPTQSSGGWNIIGNSPISFFDVTIKNPCFAKTGDKISFKSISINEYKELKEVIENKNYQIQPIL